jgi:hypothetical protein
MIGMGAKSITIVRAVTADFFFDCRAAEIPSVYGEYYKFGGHYIHFGMNLLLPYGANGSSLNISI